MIYIISGIILLLLLLLLSILIEFKIQVIYDQGELRIKWQDLGVIPRAVEDRPYNCLGMQFLGVVDTFLPPIKLTQ
jgi:hypothetical protein